MFTFRKIAQAAWRPSDRPMVADVIFVAISKAYMVFPRCVEAKVLPYIEAIFLSIGITCFIEDYNTE